MGVMGADSVVVHPDGRRVTPISVAHRCGRTALSEVVEIVVRHRVRVRPDRLDATRTVEGLDVGLDPFGGAEGVEAITRIDDASAYLSDGPDSRPEP
jgi:hypothetical protein